MRIMKTWIFIKFLGMNQSTEGLITRWILPVPMGCMVIGLEQSLTVFLKDTG